ncbi:MAG: ATP-binding protein [Chitinophagales bacterium]
MKKTIFFFLFQIQTLFAFPQSPVDSLRNQLTHTIEDSSRIKITQQLASYYSFNQTDSSIFYAKKTLELADKLNDTLAKFKCLNSVLLANNLVGNYSAALKIAYEMLRVAEQLQNNREKSLVTAHHMIGLVNREMGYNNIAYEQLREAIQLREQSLDPTIDNNTAYSQMALVFLERKKLDSALFYAQKGVDLDVLENAGRTNNLNLAILGNVHQAVGNYPLAEDYYRAGIKFSKNGRYILARIYNNIASLFQARNMPDSCLHYALASLQMCQKYNYANYALDANLIIVRLYDSLHNSDSAYKYAKVMMNLKDTLFSQQKSLQAGMLNFYEEQRQNQIDAAKEKYQNQVRTIALLTALGVFLVIAFILFRNNRLQKKAKSQIEKAYGELKSTQAQLIQAEKMASLGELTAGIAHEIQNPLNFMNNFSEVNTELIEEMKDELKSGKNEEAITIAMNISENEAKINFHGKRADAIVKGMLQHSRESKGQKEPTDLNTLADEYLRLSYQGLRAKDKSFNAALNTDFDPAIGKINIVPQDIGRVLLNLYNNAFYATAPPHPIDGNGNEQTNGKGSVWVSTRKIKDKVMISVRDNGPGIPQKVLDKIFQPFFTTKPTGQGTGLGLSLAYDIVKAHGGEIKVETKEGEGAEFIVQLPV